jgi:hypothetical protein
MLWLLPCLSQSVSVGRWHVGVDVPLLETDIMASQAVPRVVRVPMISKGQHAPGYRVVDSVVDR